MSQYPIDYQRPYDPSYQPAGPAQPGSIKVLAVLSIVFGGLFTLCTGFGLIAGLVQMAGVKLINGPAGQMSLDPTIQALGVVTSLIELVLSVALLMIGIGALSLKPWARRSATAWWSFAMIIWAVIRAIIQVGWVGPASIAMVRQMQRAPNVSAQQMEMFVKLGVFVGAGFTFLLQIAMPILFLAIWRRPSVVSAFEGNPSASSPASNPYG